MNRFSEIFGHDPEHLFSAPGRTELGGNHTDHQHGCVVAAAVDLETKALTAENSLGLIRVYSEGYPYCEIDLHDLEKREAEKNTTPSLIRGIASRFDTVSGFDAYCTSTVLPGSGLSSSAAFEVLIGTVLNTLFNNGKYAPAEIAAIGQWAENEYFGKPCGLMDQMASALGGITGIDFKDPKHPITENIDFDPASCGHALCIIDSGAGHENLTGEYAAITEEMRAAASLFGKEVLRDVDRDVFFADIARVRREAGDRAVLRAVHFFDENERAAKQLAALKKNDFNSFLSLVRESGRSSLELLQNVTPAGSTRRQDLAFVLCLAEHLLSGRGAVRVHGGGFAGTVLAFVPDDMLSYFTEKMENVIGTGACRVLSIRRKGGCMVW